MSWLRLPGRERLADLYPLAFFMPLLIGLGWMAIEWWLEGTSRGVLFHDHNDFYVYYSMRGWLDPTRWQFEANYAEYPVLALVYVTWPKFVSQSLESFTWLLQASNLVLYALAVWLTRDVGRRLLGGTEPAWWLWLLPSAIYFSLNRFDIWPAALVVGSMWCLTRGHARSGWLCFGLAVAAKLYPVFALPFFISLAQQHDREHWWHNLVYALAGFLGPALGGAWSGGWLAVVVPYTIQAVRNTFWGSTLWLFGGLGMPSVVHPKIVYVLLKIAQLAAPLWAAAYLVAHPRQNLRNQAVLAFISLAVLLLLNPFYSNQWWLWALPFAAIILPTRLVWLAAAYDAVNYLQFPAVFYAIGWWNWQFVAVVILRSLLLAWLIIVAVRQLPSGWWKLNNAEAKPYG